MKKELSINKTFFISIILIILSFIAKEYTYGFNNYGNAYFIFSSIYYILGKIGYPLFIIALGYYLLNSDFNLKNYIKNILFIIFIFVIFTFINLLFFNHNLNHFYKYLLNPFNSHLSILFNILSLYIIYPFIKRLVSNITKKESKLFIILVLLWSTLNLVGLFKEFTFTLDIPLINNSMMISYFIMGYLIKNFDSKKTKSLILSIVISLILFTYIVIITYALSKGMQNFDRTLIDNNNLLMMALALLIYYIINFNDKNDLKFKSFTPYLFGTYLFSNLIFNYMSKNYNLLKYYSAYSIIVCLIVIFFSSYFISFILCKPFMVIREKKWKKR